MAGQVAHELVPAGFSAMNFRREHQCNRGGHGRGSVGGVLLAGRPMDED